MKKIFSLILLFTLLTGCDDGDMTYKTFDFPVGNPLKCPVAADATTERYYKLNNSEALILDIAPNSLKNQSTLDSDNNNVPYTITISTSGANKLTYKNYSSSTIASGSVCNTIETGDNAEIWKGEGTLSVITVERRTNGRLDGYTHKITMQNISFYNGDETIIVNNNVLGNIDKDFNFDFNFDDTTTEVEEPIVYKCDNSDLLYTLNNDEVLSLSLTDYAAAFVNTNETLNLPLGNDNILSFKVFSGTLSSSVICTPAGGGGSITPTQTQFWKATAGTLRIVTANELGQPVYDIYAIDVLFTNTITGESFALKDIGEISTVIPNAYYFGRKR